MTRPDHPAIPAAERVTSLEAATVAAGVMGAPDLGIAGALGLMPSARSLSHARWLNAYVSIVGSEVTSQRGGSAGPTTCSSPQ